ncbi:hypothetical protein [Cohnella fermenti]|uniref:hypothetical protein n=1 Tax=Cohnella fermenti TaxID=2565925 RepID=UPI0026D2FCE8
MAGGPTPGRSIPLDQFYIADPDSSTAASMNAALSLGKNLLLTPGIYHLEDTIKVERPDTIVMGLGFATSIPAAGKEAMAVADVDGVIVASLLFDAGPGGSPSLLEVGPAGSSADHSANPTSLHDLFFRVGGAHAGTTETNLAINSGDVIGDHFWIWRADHGASAGGQLIFYQSEIPYEVPNQEAWKSHGGTVDGYSSYTRSPTRSRATRLGDSASTPTSGTRT